MRSYASVKRKWFLILWAASLPLSAATLTLAQGPNDAALPSFEVASIKLNNRAATLPGYHFYDDRFNATASAMVLIRHAYGNGMNPLNSDQVSGEPDWTRSVLYEINAKIDDSLIKGDWKKLSFTQQVSQVNLMVRSLLIERFRLKVRYEMKELPVYLLTAADHGPRLRQANCDPETAALSGRGRGKLEVTCMRMNDLASFLSSNREVGRTVLDKTDLQGRYSFSFQWSPEDLAAGNPPTDNTSAAPSLSTALRQQLGLTLKRSKAPVMSIVIEKIERPSEN